MQESRILVVEDEGLLGLMTADTLTDAGATVVGPAATVSEALAILQQNQPLDGAVLDLNLCGELSEAVAEALIARHVPFVVATGYGTGMLPRVEQRACGMLIKPYDPPDLVEMLATACRPRGVAT